MIKEQEKDIFLSNVYEYEDEYPSEMIDDFCGYWCKKVTFKGELMYRFQTQYTFVISMRLKSWARQGQPGKNNAQRRQELEKQKEQFRIRVFLFTTEYDTEMLQEFFDYWSETNEQGTAMRWQKQPTFNLNLRLKTWAKRVNQFKQRNNGNNRKPFNKQQQLQEEADARRRDFIEAVHELNGGRPVAGLPDL